jgi:hypothetical protein
MRRSRRTAVTVAVIIVAILLILGAAFLNYFSLDIELERRGEQRSRPAEEVND